MGMGFAPTWLRQVSPPASPNHSNHWQSWVWRLLYCKTMLHTYMEHRLE